MTPLALLSRVEKAAYDSHMSIPHQRLADTFSRNIKNPYATAGRISDAGDGGAALSTAAWQALSGLGLAAAGGRASAMAGTPGGKVGGLLASLLLGHLGVTSSGMRGQALHNSRSKEQFGRALLGSLSATQKDNIPSGLLDLIAEGNPESLAKILPEAAPDVMDSPFVRRLFETQKAAAAGAEEDEEQLTKADIRRRRELYRLLVNGLKGGGLGVAAGGAAGLVSMMQEDVPQTVEEAQRRLNMGVLLGGGIGALGGAGLTHADNKLKQYLDVDPLLATVRTDTRVN
jgi:hypothetical protein